MSEITQHESTKEDGQSSRSGITMVVVTVLLLTLIFLPLVVG